MPDDGGNVSSPGIARGSTTIAETSRRRPDTEDVPISALRSTPRLSPRRRLRLVLFVLLPILLIAGGYWYITGGQAMSTDDAYAEADKVGISTDVSGIVKDIDVTENQHVEAGQVLYRLDDPPFRFALGRATAQVGSVKDALNALKANYREMQAQIQQAHHDVDYYATELHRQQDLLNAHVASQSTFDMARRNLQNAQGKLASLTQQLAAIAANLDGDPDGPVEQNPRYVDAVARRDEAARQLAHTIVRAPFAGIVTNVPTIALGTYLAASVTAFYLVAAARADRGCGWRGEGPDRGRQGEALRLVRGRRADHSSRARCPTRDRGAERIFIVLARPGTRVAAGSGRAWHRLCAVQSPRRWFPPRQDRRDHQIRSDRLP
jgi:multidrug resistance efflux pump